MSRLSTSLLVTTATLLLAAASCQPPQPLYPGQLRPAADFGPDFLLRQELLFQRGELEATLQTALQHRGDELTLIGLSPLGTRAFVIHQRGLDVELTSHLPEGELPFPAQFILLDISRTLLPLDGPPPPEEGLRRLRSSEEIITETWREGRLTQRRYRRRRGRPRGEIIITYREGHRFDAPPGEILIDNGWLGYRLTLRTLDYQRLERATPRACPEISGPSSAGPAFLIEERGAEHSRAM
jgi:hypothetical protein